MKLLLESWRAYLAEETTPPLYELPISLEELQDKIVQFIEATNPLPKGDALKLKNKLEKQHGKVCAPSFGLCFDAATLMLHMAGSKAHSGLIKMRAKKAPLGPEAPGETSTHWWLKGKSDKIYDPTASQFTFGAPPPYEKGERGDIGFPYFKKGSKTYSETVPPQKVVEFAMAFREWNKETFGEDTAYGMDWWLKELSS